MVTKNSKNRIKKEVLILGLSFLLIIPFISAFNMSTSSYTVGSYHFGSAGNNASTSSYELRSTTTYEQGSNDNVTTSSYTANSGWFGVTTSLNIISTSIISLGMINGSNVSLAMSAKEFDSLWVSITQPNSYSENITLTNNTNTTFTNTTLLNRYNVTFFANDSNNNIISSSDYFETFLPIIFNFTVIDSNLDGVNSTWTVFYRDVFVFSNSSETGNHSDALPDTIVDLEVKSHTERLQVLLRSINLSSENNEVFGMDIHTEISGFLAVYEINNTYNMTNATVKIFYDDLSFSDENNLQIHKCDNYSFTGSTCLVSFVDVTNNATQNTANDFFEITVTSLSAFGIKEVISASDRGGGISFPGLPAEEAKETVEEIPKEEPEIPAQLFDIKLELEDTVIENINDLVATITFESFGFEPTPVNLTFVILNEAGEEVYREEDSIIVETEEVLRKSFEGLNLSEGKYSLILTTLYNVDVSDEFKQGFEIKGREESFIKKYLWAIVVALVILLAAIYHHYRKGETGNKKQSVQKMQGKTLL